MLIDMDITTWCTVLGTVFAVVAAFIALRQYRHDKDASEQARSVSVYIVRLYDKTDNKWTPLKTTPVGTKPAAGTNTDSMAFGLVVENNSPQAISNFSAWINSSHPEFKGFDIVTDFGKDAPLVTIPPGSWLLLIDTTSFEDKDHNLPGINSLSDVLAFEEAQVAYNPIARDKRDALERYEFQDSTMHWWGYERGKGLKRLRSHEPVRAPEAVTRVWPKPLPDGGTIGVISPGSPCTDMDSFNAACDWLRGQGFKLKFSSHLNEGDGYLAGSAQDRAADFNAMVLDDEVDAIIAARGGCGSAQIVDLIDYHAFAEKRKPFMGFSDITSLHLALMARTNVVTFHGPVLTSFSPQRFCEDTAERALAALKQGRVDQPDLSSAKVLNKGEIRGPIVGGNLTRLCGSLGTWYEIQTTGHVLLLEECGCEPWEVLDHLVMLKNAGKFKGINGIIFGEGFGVGPDESGATYPNGETLDEVIKMCLGDLDVPVVYDLPLGHTKKMWTVAEGAPID